MEELIEKNQINFTPSGLKINQHQNGNFQIIYQDLVFNNLYVGEAIPFLIALTSLLEYKPIVTLDQINEEMENFVAKFREYNNYK